MGIPNNGAVVVSTTTTTTVLRTLLVLVLVSLITSIQIQGATTHSHRHSNNPSPGHHERVEDGAYAPRSSKHFDGHGHAHDGDSNSKSDDDDHDHHHNQGFDHEAILGSTKEAEEYDNLPPEEAKRRLRILVGKMDLDKNGMIERTELKAWILRSFRMLSDEEAKEQFEEVDEDDDGLVSWKEYVAETFGVDTDEAGVPLENLEEAKMLSDDKALFGGADKNHDGSLDIKEYLAFTHPEEDPDMLPIVLAQTLADKDTNGDGQIDFKEYVGDRGKDKSQEWITEEKAKFDLEHDKDSDGLLNRQEILSWVLPSNEEIAEDEVTHLFAASDDDHSLTLSYDEILDHHDTFVGSEATDYGDHLHYLDRFTDEL